MNVGDNVVLTVDGQVRVLPKDAAEAEGGQVLGEIVELRDRPEEHLVALPPPDPNVKPPLATLRSVMEKFAT